MGLSRDTMHKRRHTGGKRAVTNKKRKYLNSRPGAFTKLGSKRIHLVRCRGGAIKHRAMRLDTGNFSWSTENITRKTRILDVVWNSTNNELLRTKTLVKNCIVQIDASAFRQAYEKHYGVLVGTKRPSKKNDEAEDENKPKSKKVQTKLESRQKDRELDPQIEEQFNSGRLFACVSSRPGQSGRCDGYILEGEELRFYKRMLDRKKGKKNQ
ncbi:40S ribosomal protein S8 [Hondaea fermentalgiana]|uniref:40S ribosomal protein S8 n=1 Tax=Hondaea fermentalgiana TaxID=2315210 RepID=A0A2R5GUT8_9STRA|nr:40S ribosomal protein S8 [Hondaea fermentalgiana]|eukprot:GBG32151.1 40S ribosomal protein S8 [Hondaea fermentalgiana]